MYILHPWHSFNLFISILGAIVLLLTAFYPRRFNEPYPSGTGQQFTILCVIFFLWPRHVSLNLEDADGLVLSLVPLLRSAIYPEENADIQKDQIYSDNKEKCGVYRWICLETGESYVGSMGGGSARPIYQEDLINILV